MHPSSAASARSLCSLWGCTVFAGCLCCADAVLAQYKHARRTVNDLIWKEIQEKNAQFKADNDAYWEAEQVYRKWAAEDRRRRRAPHHHSSLELLYHSS